jgi:hypothetical protein
MKFACEGAPPLLIRTAAWCKLSAFIASETRFQPAGRQAAAGSRRLPARRSFFKSLLCLEAASRVKRAPRNAAEIKRVQQLAGAMRMRMNIEFGGDAVTRIGTAPAHHATGLAARAIFHPLRHFAPRACAARRRACPSRTMAIARMRAPAWHPPREPPPPATAQRSNPGA